MKPVPPEKPVSLPLTAPDGEILTYACGLCRRVHAGASSWGPPDAEQRAGLAETHKMQADGCCVCSACGKVEKGASLRCVECDAKQRSEWRAIEESEETKSAEQRQTDAARERLFWARSKDGAGPIATIVADRYGWEGAEWLAFPGFPDDVDGHAFSDDPLSHQFWMSGAAAYVGRGDTPDAALADLVRIAEESSSPDGGDS